jgi:glycosyltransferase involved in cell wall biosynthesis
MVESFPAVAVVVPAFNARHTLGSALASVAGQQVQPDEVVVVDDASSDDTVTIAREWKSLLPLRVVELPANVGPGRARHEGVSRTSAPLLAFLDADDLWLPNHLEACLAQQARTGGVVTGRALLWDEELGVLPDQDAFVEFAPPGQALEWLVRHHVFGMHAVLPRVVYERVGGFDPQMEGAEDWDLWLRIAAARVPMSRTDAPTFLYRQHATNLSRDVERVSKAAVRVLDRVERQQRPLSRDLRAAVRDSRALIAYNWASARLDAGDYAGARGRATAALGGPLPLSARAVAIATAPRLYRRARRHRRR